MSNADNIKKNADTVFLNRFKPALNGFTQ